MRTPREMIGERRQQVAALAADGFALLFVLGSLVMLVATVSAVAVALIWHTMIPSVLGDVPVYAVLAAQAGFGLLSVLGLVDDHECGDADEDAA